MPVSPDSAMVTPSTPPVPQDKDRAAPASALESCMARLELEILGCMVQFQSDLRQQIRAHKVLVEDVLSRDKELLVPAFSSEVEYIPGLVQETSVQGPRSAWYKGVSAEGKALQKVRSQAFDLGEHKRSIISAPSQVWSSYKQREAVYGHSGTNLQDGEDKLKTPEMRLLFGKQTTASQVISDWESSLERPSRNRSFLAKMATVASVAFRSPGKGGFVHSAFFNLISGLAIMANAMLIGYQTHWNLSYKLEHFGTVVEEWNWHATEMVFICFFALELALRVANDRLEFIRGSEWRWNLFDCIIVCVSLVESVASNILANIGMNFPFLRLVRIARVLRVLKVLHMIPFFSRLGIMMSSIVTSLEALAPAIVLLVLVMYVFGICIMQGIINRFDGVVSHLQIDDEWGSVIKERFGTLSDTTRTLFMSVHGGLSWLECVEALDRTGAFNSIVYMFYVGFQEICVLNIVTGVFVDTVHQMYRPEREEMVERESTKRKVMLQNLRTLLQEADKDESGTITWSEFQSFIADHRIRMYLAAHEIDIKQAREVFDLIDSNGSGEVGIDEFAFAFFEMKGAAKGADFLILRNDVHKVLNKLVRFIHEQRKSINDLKTLAQRSVGSASARVTVHRDSASSQRSSLA